MNRIEIRLLGPIELEVGGRVVPLRRRQVRALLALLALHPVEGVLIDTIIDALWDDELPGDPRHAVHVYVSRLRSLHPALADAVVTTPGGYRLDAHPEQTDAARFEAHAAAAHAELARAPWEALRLLDGALALWRGRAFGSLHYAEFLANDVRRLEERLLHAKEDAFEADLRLGRAARVIAGLQQMTQHHPYRDRPVQLLVSALEADGRRTEALVAHRSYCQRIRQEFGVQPEFPFPTPMVATI